MRFSYYEPTSADEAVQILSGPHGTFKALAGGTDVLINLRRRAVAYDGLVNVKRIPGMTDWSAAPGQGLRIGASVPFGELEASPEVARRYPALLEAIKVIGSLQLRNLATIGGNLCNASPAADSAPCSASGPRHSHLRQWRMAAPPPSLLRNYSPDPVAPSSERPVSC